MVGTLTLFGTQKRNVFVDETGREYKIYNVSVCGTTSKTKYTQLIKYNDKYWYEIRSLYV